MDLKPKGLLRRMFDFAVSELDRRSRSPQRFAPESKPASAESPPDEPHSTAPSTPLESQTSAPVAAELPLDVTREGSGALMVRWALTTEDVEAARPLAPEAAALSLRVVAFSAAGCEVRREVLDLPADALIGHLTLQRPEQERVVVSVGLLASDAFVSIVHVQLA